MLATERKPGNSGNRLTTHEYTRAKTMWSSGNYTLEDISLQFQISKQALHRRFRKDGVNKGDARVEHQQAAKAALERESTKNAKKHADWVARYVERQLKGLDFIGQHRLRILIEQIRAGKPVAALLGDMKVLNEASKGMQIDYANISNILGLDKQDLEDEELPELIMRELTLEEIQEMRDRQALEYEDLPELPDLSDDKSVVLEE